MSNIDGPFLTSDSMGIYVVTFLGDKWEICLFFTIGLVANEVFMALVEILCLILRNKIKIHECSKSSIFRIMCYKHATANHRSGIKTINFRSTKERKKEMHH